MVTVTLIREIVGVSQLPATITAETVSVIGRDVIVPGWGLPIPLECVTIQSEFMDANLEDEEVIYS